MIINLHIKKYDDLIYQRGFNFQQQYELTKFMKKLLKSNLNLLDSYKNLLFKIDVLVKRDSLYKYYNSIYPSPEMQVKWLSIN